MNEKWPDGKRLLRYTPEREARAHVKAERAMERRGRKKAPHLAFWVSAWSCYAMALTMSPKVQKPES